MRSSLLLGFWPALCLFLGMSCARINEPISQQDQFVNNLLVSTLRAADPNSLDKVVSSRSDPDGSNLTQINATNDNFYIYFSLTTNRQIPQSQAGTQGWDVAFNRYKLATNSGATNSGGRGGACLSNQSQINISIPRANQGCPDASFVQDSVATTQGIGGASASFVGNSLLSDWFSYRIGELTPKAQTYILRSGDGTAFFSFRMENYYNSSGTSGYPTFRWRRFP